jgi:beta-glucanase (GH16 family)
VTCALAILTVAAVAGPGAGYRSTHSSSGNGTSAAANHASAGTGASSSTAAARSTNAARLQPAAATSTAPPMPAPNFDDEFNGTTLGSQWTALNRVGDTSNSELECYIPDNAIVAAGMLTLTDRVDSFCTGYGSPYAYSSAMVQTRTFNFTYGTIIFRAKLPSGQGQWPGLWLLGANCQASNIMSADNSGTCQWPVPGSDEIDVFEGVNADTTHGHFNLHTGDSPNNDNHTWGCNGVQLSVDTHTDFHTYMLIWHPGSLQWYIDGVNYCSTTNYVPTTPMFLIMNIAVGGSSIGPVDPKVMPQTMPQTMQIDFVRVYQ